MKSLSLLKVGLLSAIFVFCANQSIASTVEIEIAATISHSFIMSGDGSGNVESASLWSLDSGLPIGSTLHLGLSYDSGTPSSIYWHSPLDLYDYDLYKGASISIATNDFQLNLPNSAISIGANGSDIGLLNHFTALFSAPDNTGVSLTFENEIYYLLEASISMMDESGTTLNNSSLLTNQSQFDAFWLNNSEPGKYSDHLARFEMVIVKDPLVNSYPNGIWPSGDALYVVGYFNELKLTHAQVPEPTGLILLLMGSAGIFVRRFWRK